MKTKHIGLILIGLAVLWMTYNTIHFIYIVETKPPEQNINEYHPYTAPINTNSKGYSISEMNEQINSDGTKDEIIYATSKDANTAKANKIGIIESKRWCYKGSYGEYGICRVFLTDIETGTTYKGEARIFS